MKQLLQNLRSGETFVTDVPIPDPQPGTALVRNAASLISAGTERKLVEFAQKTMLGKARSRPDLVRRVLDKARREGLLTAYEAAQNRLDQPMPLGYSSAGTIISIGSAFKGFQVGDRVACAGGGFAVHAEYVIVPQNLMVKIPNNVDFASAAHATLGAIALHGYRLTDVQIGAQVAVIGLGLLGILASKIALAAGCHVVGIDIDADRVSLTKELGIKAVLREQAVQAAMALSGDKGVDAVLICADTPSSDPVQLAGEITRDKGKVVSTGVVGLDLPRDLYFEKELDFVVSRSYGPGRYDSLYEEKGQDYPIGYVRWTEGRNMEAFIDLVARDLVEIEPLITHRFPIDNAPAAYDMITADKAEPHLSVILTYEHDEEQDIAEGQTTPYRQTTTQRSSDTIKLGVLGAGNFAAAVMIPILKKVPDVKLIGIASATGASASHIARKYPFQYATSRSDQIIQDEDINTVAVLTRHHLHAAQVIASLEAGKHVFCEKPLCISEDELEEIESALRAGQAETALLMVGFNRRFAPLTKKLRGYIQGGSEPLVINYRVNAGYLPRDHWLQDPHQGGGRLIGEACHFLDFLTFLTDHTPNSISTYALPDDGRYSEDNLVVVCNFPDGSVGTITYLANGDRSFPKERVEVFTGGSVAVLDDFRSLEMIKDGRRKVVRSRLRQDKGHLAEMIAFKDAIVNGESPPIPYEHIFGVMRATFAAVRSLKEGKRIHLTEMPV